MTTISSLLKSLLSFATEPCKRDDILQKRPMILRSLLIVGLRINKLIRKSRDMRAFPALHTKSTGTYIQPNAFGVIFLQFHI